MTAADRWGLLARHAESVAWAQTWLDRINALPRLPSWPYAVQNMCDRPDDPPPGRLCACGCRDYLPPGMAVSARYRPDCRKAVNRKTATASAARKKAAA
ncbi:hypothetical protein [Streptomyces sp. NBC_01304]|uniref:hypothetical protein n=1 Tax=Streptomyces sp. NBC_01304 TaxID=2903818 RepID=UPI002E0E413E|nr:hypothetical protein OG430_44945 [Streptomyces sp. NBC_01304]